MRRLTAVGLVPALAISSAVMGSLHVHQYTEHDHPAHHHGPASHDHPSTVDHHEASSSRDNGLAAARLEPCDPGRHVVAVKMGFAPPPLIHVSVGEFPGPGIVIHRAGIQFTLSITDVRAHGPPFDARVPARAPPLNPHA